MVAKDKPQPASTNCHVLNFVLLQTWNSNTNIQRETKTRSAGGSNIIKLILMILYHFFTLQLYLGM